MGFSFATLAMTIQATICFAACGVFTPTSLMQLSNVKDWGAKGDGITDDTAAIQQAVNVLSGHQFQRKTLYFPVGTYVVSSSILWPKPAYFTMQGESMTSSIIKLKDNNDLGNVTSPKAVIDVVNNAAHDNVAFQTYVKRLTIDIGAHNNYTSGLRYIGNNVAAIREVIIRSSDANHVGAQGLDLTGSWPGPSLIRDVRIEGFNVSVDMQHQCQYSMTFENITLSEFQSAGFVSTCNGMFVRNLNTTTSFASARAVYNSGRAAVVVQASMSNTASKSPVAAIYNTGNLFVRDAQSQGYDRVLYSSTSFKIFAQDSDQITEFASLASYSLFNNTGWNETLRIPVPDLPEFCPTLSEIVGVNATNASNFTRDFQAALNSGSPAVFVSEQLVTPDIQPPKYTWLMLEDTIFIPKHVRKVFFQNQPLSVSKFPQDGRPVVVAEGDAGDPPLIIDSFTVLYNNNHPIPNSTHFVIQGTRTVVFKDGGFPVNRSGPGVTFLDNTAVSNNVVRPGQELYAWQFNTEGHHGQQVLSTNQGGTLWAFGMKTEGAMTLIENQQGAKTEVFGGFFYPVTHTNDTIPMIKTADSDVSIVAIDNFVGVWPVQVESSMADRSMMLLANVTGTTFSLFGERVDQGRGHAV